MRLSTQGFIAAALCALSLLSFQPAHAQGQPASPAISDQKLDATAAAMQRVDDLQKNYRAKLQNAPPADQGRVTDEADKAFEKAVTDQGLSLEEFSSILETAQHDPSVRERLTERLHSPAK
ncbi:MAG TPA: DUF4168 domain-containing protein [Stellaceae bacterium]|nr:DUF4168 domain-containing protein [Stellaceae bacterium]